MSESTSPIPGNASKPTPADEENPSVKPAKPDPLSDDRRRIGAVPWIPVSIVLHLMLLVLVVIFAPVDRVMQTTEADAVSKPIQAERVEYLSKLVEQLNAEVLRNRVEEIMSVREQVEQIEAAVLEDYRKMEAELKATAATDALEKQAKALAEQQAAAAALAEAVEAKDREAQAEAMRLAREAQVRVEDAQIEAGRALTLAGELYQAAKREQAQAQAGQEEAEAEQTAADKAQREQVSAEQQLSRAEDELTKREATREATQVKAQEAQAKLEAAEKALAEQNDALAAVQSNPQKRLMERIVRNAQSQLNRTARVAAQAKAKAEQAQAALAEARKAVAHWSEALAPTREAMEAAAKQALSVQKQAIDQQARAMEQLKKAMQKEGKQSEAPSNDASTEPQIAKVDPSRASDAGAGDPEPSNPDTPEAAPTSMNTAQLYDHAKAEEQRVLDAYHQMRSAQLAVIRKIPLEEAMASVDRLQSNRPDIAEALSEEFARTAATLAAQKDAVATALRESRSMVDNSQRVLMLASTLAQASTPTPQLIDLTESTTDVERSGDAQDTQTLASLDQRLNEIGAGDTGSRVKDVTDIMAGRSTSPADATSTPSPAAAVGTQATETNVADTPAEARDQHRDTPPDLATPPPLARNMPTVSGRKIARTPDAQHADWMAVRTWYMIGPWPNPKRKNIDRSYPPESAVDLDATYDDGKDGRTLRWQFLQSPSVAIVPPDLDDYAIYYAYTEIYSDQDRDLWIAVGSDDKSVVWINDFKVWESASEHKGWRIDEGFRRVHLRKGVNRVLYRLENGHLGAALSLVVQLSTTP